MNEIRKVIDLCRKMDDYLLPYGCNVEITIFIGTVLFDVVDERCKSQCVFGEVGEPRFYKDCKVPRDVIYKMVEECLLEE